MQLTNLFRKLRPPNARKTFIQFLPAWLFLTTSVVTLVTWGNPKMRAVLGMRNPLEFGLWIFVYGLMVYLPAYCVPRQRKALPPRWWMYPLAIIAPLPFELLVPLPVLAGLFFPHHPQLHFPPLGP